MKKEVANLTERVSHLAKELEDHKNITALEIGHLQSSIQSAIDDPSTEAESKPSRRNRLDSEAKKMSKFRSLLCLCAIS